MKTIRPLTNLVANREAGGYTLPDELLEAHAAYERLRATQWPETARLDVETAAARLVASAAAGTVDLESIAREVVESDQARAVDDRARAVLREGIDQATETANLLVSDLSTRVITEHLRPAFDALLEDVRASAAALAGYSLSAHALLSAPSKVRNTYLQLPALVARHKALLDARSTVNAIAERRPQHDVTHLFGGFRRPLMFFPTWKAPARVPRIPFPEDPTDFMLWLVTDPQAVAAEPWLPTIAEQDEAWWDQFGEAQEMRAKHALSARAYAGQRV